MKKNLAIALFSSLLIASFAACSAETEVIEVEKQVVVEKEVEVEKKEKGLVIYSGRSESLVGPIIEEFSKQQDNKNKHLITLRDDEFLLVKNGYISKLNCQ